MVYLIAVLFTVLSIVVIITLFDPQLYSRLRYTLKGRVRAVSGCYRYPNLSTLNKAVMSGYRHINKSLTSYRKKSSVVTLLSSLIIITTAGLCYLLLNTHSLAVYHADTVAANANLQVNQILLGERLRPPPPPPEDLFEQLDAEIASYRAEQVDIGYWSNTNSTMSRSGSSLLRAEPNMDIQTMDDTAAYSDDILSSHLINGHINIKNADRNWKKMNSDFVQRLLTVYKVMSEQYGYDMVLLEGYRSPARQARLLKKGSHVTKAGSYKSYHQFGLAGDSAFIRNGKIVISEKDPWAMQGYRLYGEVAKSAGLVWGGDWKMMDLGHVELRKKGVLGRPDMAEILTRQ